MTAAVAPRRTRLVRVPTLAAGQSAVAALVAHLDVAGARDAAIVVPSAGAAAQLRRTIERLLAGGRVAAGVHEQLGLAPPPGRTAVAPAPLRAAVCFPAMVTRAGLHALLHVRLAGAPPPLDEFAREALMRAAAADAARAGAPAPFTVRPGILGEMVAFYDAILRLRRSVDDVERLLVGTLAAEAEGDRGAERLLRQTEFLVAAYRAFERRKAAVNALDEHAIRERALAHPPTPALRHVVICVADATAEPAGLWPADFDLLTRLPGLERIDVIATDAVLSAGFDERLEQRLPGIAGCRVDTFAPPPALRVPDVPGGERFFVSRDREEELNLVAREVKRSRAQGAPHTPDDHAIVVSRPLPYLYLARHTLDAAGVPWTASDSLPLAAEPYAALVDLAGETVLAACSRGALASLLRSPHLRVALPSGAPLGHDEVRRLDQELERASFFGGFEPLRALLESRVAEAAAEPASPTPGASAHDRARLGAIATAVLDLVTALEPLSRPGPLSQHASTLLAWLERFESSTPGPLDDVERHVRARAAVRSALRRIAEAAVAHDDPDVELRVVLATLRRWIESRTFQPRVGEAGVHLLDADAARFADAACAWVLGVVDGDWPPATRRDIFYPSSLLSDLGWPREAERTAAARAHFVDLLHLARTEVAVSTFTLEDDAVVEPAVLLEELDHAVLPVERTPAPPPMRTSIEHALWFDPVNAEACPPEARPWLVARQRLAAADAARFTGRIGAWAVRSHAVTQVDTWIECPFRYFARHVLDLEDEREQEPGLSPRERGELVHAIFERFFTGWSEAGHGAVTPVTLGAARQMLREVAEEAFAGVEPSDAAIERARLLGSAVAAGMADRVLELDVERALPVEERRLEHRFEGNVAFPDAGGTRPIAIRGKADRIDLLAGGRLDLFDYKTGRAPSRGVQLPVYAHIAEQLFAGYGGLDWKAAAADYVAFRGRPVTHALGGRPEERDARLRAALDAFVAAVDAIGGGDFPPRPADLRTCTWCPYDAVCRKDYVDPQEGEADAEA